MAWLWEWDKASKVSFSAPWGRGRRGFFLGYLSYPPQGAISENASCPRRRDRAAGQVPPFPASASLLPSTTTPCSPTAPPLQHRHTERRGQIPSPPRFICRLLLINVAVSRDFLFCRRLPRLLSFLTSDHPPFKTLEFYTKVTQLNAGEKAAGGAGGCCAPCPVFRGVGPYAGWGY